MSNADEDSASIDGCIRKGVDLGDLLERLPVSVIEQVAGHTRGDRDQPTNRQLLTTAITGYLPDTVRELIRLGFAPHTVQHQRPRAFDKYAWRALEVAEGLTGLSKITLMRAILIRMGRDGLSKEQTSLRAVVEELNKLG